MRLLTIAAAGALALAPARPAAAQERVTRAEAVARAVERGPRLAVSRADSAVAAAQVAVVRQFENPVLSLGYSKDAPQQHAALDVPVDYPWLRNPRIASAQAALGAAVNRFTYERQSVAFDADTAYTRAQAIAARARLSARSARAADSLVAIARIRRDAGDGSELDVQLAAVSAGQVNNTAAADSLEAITALLAVQAAMGLAADAETIVIADTLEAPPPAAPTANGVPLLIAAASEDARAAELNLALERRRVFAAPSLTVGFDTHDPGGNGNQILPMFGVAVPLPLFNRNRGAVMLAQANHERALATLRVQTIETTASRARAMRAYTVAAARLERSRQLVDGANRVAALSVLAYREGAATLASVLEAQRTARELLAQYVEDLASMRNAAGLVRLLQLSAAHPIPATSPDR